MPQHAKTAKETVHILSANKAKIGPIDEWLNDVSKRFYDFLPTAPQVIQVNKLRCYNPIPITDKLAWTGNLKTGQLAQLVMLKGLQLFPDLRAKITLVGLY